MDSNRPGLLVHEQPQGRTVRLKGERLPLTYIEGTRGIPGEDVFLDEVEVGLDGCAGQSGGCVRQLLAEGT